MHIIALPYDNVKEQVFLIVARITQQRGDSCNYKFLIGDIWKLMKEKCLIIVTSARLKFLRVKVMRTWRQLLVFSYAF